MTRSMRAALAGLVAVVVAVLVGCSSAPHHPAAVHPETAVPSGATSSGSLGLHGFHAVDLSFVGTNDGWALGTATCVKQPSETCTALAHTTDGTRWTGLTGDGSTPFNVSGSCAAPCVENIRFADDQVGYAYGPSAFFMTTNGGNTWTQEPGGADALETLDHNVIRLVSPHGGCPGPCSLSSEYAPVGSTDWTSAPLSSATINVGTVSMVRTGSTAFVETSDGQAGSLYGVTLYTSASAGRSWSAQPDPCRIVGAAAVGVATASQNMTVADDGSISILCATGSPTKYLTVTSRNGGNAFAAGPLIDIAGAAKYGDDGPLGAASATVFVLPAGRGLYRTTNSGRTWNLVSTDESAAACTSAFQSSRVGRCVNGSTILTTHDAGATWSSYTFPS